MFSRLFIDVFLPDMRFPHVFIDIWPLEFLGFGSLGCLLEPFGVTVAVLGPPWVLFWMIFALFRSLWPQKQSRRWWIQDVGSVFVSFWRYSVSLDNGSTDVSLWFWKLFLWLCLWLFQWLCIWWFRWLVVRWLYIYIYIYIYVYLISYVSSYVTISVIGSRDETWWYKWQQHYHKTWSRPREAQPKTTWHDRSCSFDCIYVFLCLFVLGCYAVALWDSSPTHAFKLSQSERASRSRAKTGC